MTKKGAEYIILRKIYGLPWLFVFLIFIVSALGFAMLYSAAKGNIDPWASRQMVKFAIGIPMMLAIAIIDIRFWFRFAHFGYLFGIALLILVEVSGITGMGAQRWLSIGGFRFQPSELMKVFLVLSIARYFHLVHPANIKKLGILIVPIFMIGIAAVLVLKQPNLGTATIITMTGVAVIFVAGIGWKKFVIAGIIAIAMIPIGWTYMHDYQKTRVRTFLAPETDPLGAGYNIIQSKIAIGSGGFWGKGFLEGTQSQLSFVPEKQTDFIFSIIAEEFGFLGGLATIVLYGLMIICGISTILRSESLFGKMVATGITTTLFVHVFINIGMVMGILPVVGVPLPLLSYGGSSMISTLIGFGYILNVHVHRKIKIRGKG